jgi:hypothetical protein
MNNPCDAVRLFVAVTWSAVALAFLQPGSANATVSLDQPDEASFANFEVSLQGDLDIAASIGTSAAPRDVPVVDLRLRMAGEQVLDDGKRWGVRLGLAANSGDGRRGFSQNLSTGPVQANASLSGLATGFVSAPGLDAGSGRVGVTEADFYLTGRWAEWRAGSGKTAAATLNARPASALRLVRADRAMADLVGGGLSHTGLSLSAPSGRAFVQTRRIIGLSAAASYTPDAARCGIDQCRPGDTATVLSPDISHLVSLAVDFDRRRRETGARWQAHIGFEAGQVESALVSFEDPWIASASLAREANDVTLGASVLQTNDGLESGEYTAWAGFATYERGDWFYSVELAHGRSSSFDADGGSLALGASRWISDMALLSFGFVTHERGGSAGVIETGLRF